MADNARFPYLSVPKEACWRESMSGRSPREIDPHLNTRLRIGDSDKIASAGSCFAQRIAELIQKSGYNYFLTEEGPPLLSTEEKRRMGYGVYSARYGNVYSALQLLQLFRRAFGRFDPAEPVWRLKTGRYVDPFRPSVQPDGFESESECLQDRQAHLASVRRMFQEVNVFIFTLGVTEVWKSSADGAVFPACPGSSLGGTYDPSRHVFHNFKSSEVTEHLDAFIVELKEVNPKAQIILTVSPVPLLATFEARHVLQSNVYSKSVLRVASEEVVEHHTHVHYFASYEIVTATGDSGAYFLDDRRSVSDAAVEHVIECFLRQFMMLNPSEVIKIEQKILERPVKSIPNDTMCDEDRIMAALADQAAEGR
jgi:hypothetical protein